MKTLIFLFIYVFALTAWAIGQNAPAAGIPYLGKRTGDPTCNASRKGFTYYNTTSNIYRYCNGSTWADVGGGGVTVGTTTSNGTVDTLLKTDSSGKVNDATGITSPSSNNLLINPTSVGTASSINFAGAGTDRAGIVYEVGTGDIQMQSRITPPRNWSFGISASLQEAYIGSNSLSLRLFQFDTGNFRTVSGNQIGWSSSSTLANTAADAGLKRVAPSVVGITDGSTNLGYLQQAGNLRVTADVTNSTTTLAALTGILTPTNLAAGRTYSFIAKISVADSAAADGVKIAFDGGTVTATAFRAQCTITDTALRTASQVTALATTIAAATITGDTIIDCSGTITVNAAGTFGIRQAQNAHTAGTLTNYRGSFMWIRDMP